MMKICPYCKQGTLLKAKVKALDSVVCVCGECDTVWEEYEPVSDRTGKTFDCFSEEYAVQPSWEELVILE